MTPELTWLAWSALLTAFLWIPYIVARSIMVEFPNPRTYQDPTPPHMPAWIKRMDRAHLNAVESLVPFAAIVLIAHVAEISNTMTVMWSAVFFYSRLGHAVIYWTGIPYVRTLAFAVGFAATLGVFFEVITAVPAM